MEWTRQQPSMISLPAAETLSGERLKPVPIAFRIASFLVHNEKNFSKWLSPSRLRKN